MTLSQMKREVREPPYCDLVALNSSLRSVSSSVTAPAVQITWICAKSLLLQLLIKIRRQDVDAVYIGMFHGLFMASVVQTHVPQQRLSSRIALQQIFGMCFNLFSGYLLQHIIGSRSVRACRVRAHLVI